MPAYKTWNSLKFSQNLQFNAIHRHDASIRRLLILFRIDKLNSILSLARSLSAGHVEWEFTWTSPRVSFDAH